MGVSILDLGGPPLVIPHDKVGSDEELPSFIAILFTLEPKEFSLQERFLKYQLTVEPDNKHPNPLHPAELCPVGELPDRPQQLARHRVHLAGGYLVA